MNSFKDTCFNSTPAGLQTACVKINLPDYHERRNSFAPMAASRGSLICRWLMMQAYAQPAGLLRLPADAADAGPNACAWMHGVIPAATSPSTFWRSSDLDNAESGSLGSPYSEKRHNHSVKSTVWISPLPICVKLFKVRPSSMSSKQSDLDLLSQLRGVKDMCKHLSHARAEVKLSFLACNPAHKCRDHATDVRFRQNV